MRFSGKIVKKKIRYFFFDIAKNAFIEKLLHAQKKLFLKILMTESIYLFRICYSTVVAMCQNFLGLSEIRATLLSIVLCTSYCFFREKSGTFENNF